MDYYKQIFKRKSFHIFRGTETVSEQELIALKEFITDVKPLDDSIRTEIDVAKESDTTCKRGAEYCVMFYSEKKDGYLQNIGYIGEQIDLYLSSVNIGALWFGIGKAPAMQKNGLDFVIMIAIAKMPADKFRKDMFKSKRKPIEEIWQGDTIGIAEIVRFTPSACNTQPWITENNGKVLTVYRYKKPGKRGIMPTDKVMYYNRIDIGIYLFMLETCLGYEGYDYTRELFSDMSDNDVEKTLVAKYKYNKK